MTFFLALILALTTPCQYEDSNNCYWDAQSNGNGQGSSFITINDHVYYF